MFCQNDFRNPGVIGPVKAVTPQHNAKEDIICPNDEESTRGTTYMKDFRVWEDARRRETYKVIEVYTPPREKMTQETNYTSDFLGRNLCILYSAIIIIEKNLNINFLQKMFYFSYFLILQWCRN